MSSASSSPAEVVVIDGTAILFRAYYGAPPAQSPDGTPVGAVLGALRTLVDVMGRTQTVHVVVVFDAGQRTFRNDLDPAYKANRGAPPPDLVPQFDLVQEAVRALGFATSCIPGYEADDLMATLARVAREQGRGAWLLSPDKDLFQLVVDSAPPVRVYHWHTRSVIDGAAVKARLGVSPEQAVDYFALVGDSSDNVQGVRGVGPKAASALVASLGDLRSIYARLDEVVTLKIRGAKSLRAKLEAGQRDAELALKLVTLRDDVDLGLERPLETWARWKGPTEGAGALFAALGSDAPLNAMRTIYALRATHADSLNAPER